MLNLRKLVTDWKVHVFLALFPGEMGGGGGCETLESQYTFIWGENQKKKSLTSSPVEALILSNEEHQGLLKLQVPLGWEWGRME